ncbi:MAG: isopentenyl-diphosphate Delta-isomerase [Flavobacteriales bacterium]
MNLTVQEYVILVDRNDQQIGTMEKMEAHRLGALHRAFSVFVFNSNGELLLQQRALGKYHSPGLWTNTCCSHPRPEEKTPDAAQRRLIEEMGFVTPLEKAFSFIYKVQFENDLFEHELDHVFIGEYDEEPKINPEEVAAYRWTHPDEVMQEMQDDPELFTAWFRICFEEMYDWYNLHLKNKKAS